MPEKNKQLHDFLPMPPPPANELETKRPKLWRQKIGKRLGAVLFASAALAQPVSMLDSLITAERYPADSVEIIQAAGSEKIPKGGTEWLVFGGYGQKYSTNAAQELFNAMGSNQVVASVKYPNQEFTIEDLADYVAAYIKERGMSTLNVAGVSMGTPIALMTLSHIEKHTESPYPLYQNAAFVGAGLDQRKLPKIGYWAAYSSPADYEDASQGALAEKIVTISEKLNYSPGMLGKFVASTVDGEGDALRTLNIRDTVGWLGQMQDSLSQTFNDTPPKMTASLMKFIVKSKEENRWEDWHDLFSADSYFIYVTPNGTDSVVDTSAAYKRYQVGLQHYDVATSFIKANEPGHANTGASASAVGNLIASIALAQPTNVVQSKSS